METEITDPIIILGPGRSGSKLVQNILNNNEQVYICPEMNFHSRYKSSIYSVYQKNKEDKNFPANLLMKIYEIKGKAKSFINSIDDQLLIEKFNNTNQTAKALFSLLVSEKANKLKPNATRLGAKFPFHFHFSGIFTKWYPNTMYIYLYRDPRAVLASELIMKSKKSVSTGFPIFKTSVINRLLVNIYVLIQYFTYYFHLKQQLKNKKLTSVKILNFADLVTDPKNSILSLCDFCEIEYSDKMKDVMIYGSSFHRKNKGFNKDALNKWEEKLLSFEKLFFKKIQSKFQILFKKYNLNINVHKN